MIERRIVGFAIAAAVAGCGAPASGPDDDGTWVGTVSTEGNVTTVAAA